MTWHKGYKDIAIITDAIIDAVEKGEKSYAGKTIEVKQIAAPRCAAVIKGSTTIAGSCTTQLEMFSNLTTAMGATPEQVRPTEALTWLGTVFADSILHRAPGSNHAVRSAGEDCRMH
jgi:N-acetylglucosamine-6-phosphate deacetylase